MSVNATNTTAAFTSVGLFIGSLSGLEATGLIVGIIVTLAVGVTAIRKNVAETRLANIKLSGIKRASGSE